VDPRLAIIEQRLEGVGRIIAVAAGKGGVGKSSVAAVLALALADRGYKVGLLDLDFYGPSTHLVLGIAGVSPKEDQGIRPPHVHGIEFMSLVCYTGGRPAPLRGREVSGALIELLAITRWSPRDFLIVDMPPGLGDTTLDVIRLLRRAEFLIVTTPSRITQETVKKLIALLGELAVPVVGVVENMARSNGISTAEDSKIFGVRCLGRLPLDEQLEDALGVPAKLRTTAFANAIGETVRRITGTADADG
jgi:ATP-binding protein involved in chromosome partitioning